MEDNNLIALACPYCGQQQMVKYDPNLTPIEEEALAAMACNCPGSWIVRQEEKIKNMVSDDLDEDETMGVIEAVKIMRRGYFDRMTIKKEKFTYTISINSENVMKFKRQESKKQEMTL